MKGLRNYQPEIVGVVVGLAVLNLWYLSAVIVEGAVVPQSYDYLVQTMTVAIGGFIGAFSAFWLKSHSDNTKENNRQKEALNSALFVLVRQINAIQVIKRDLDKFTNPFDRGLSLPAMKPPDYSNVKQNIESLYFLMENDNANTLMELTIEQERFEQAINSINIRNEFYVNEVQPALSFYALNGKPLPLGDFEEKLGERLFQGAINGAATMYDHVYSCEISLNKKYTSLRELAKELFPAEKFVEWVNK